jgi:cysteinyl-tRNA synthetase
MEAAFFDDLRALGARPPHAAPRVTDHMPQVVAYVEKIVAQGFAYAAGQGDDKSVYFDVAAFRKAGHTYGKLKPWAVRDFVMGKLNAASVLRRRLDNAHSAKGRTN